MTAPAIKAMRRDFPVVSSFRSIRPRRTGFARRGWFLLTVGVALLGCAGGVVRADSIWYGAGESSLQTDGTVLRIDRGSLVWQNARTGASTSRPLDQVKRLRVDGEPSLNVAEEAYATEKYQVAAEAYDKAITETRKDWVKERAALRLLQAAQKTGQFPLTAVAFARLAAVSPDTAAEQKPAIPEDKALVAKAIPPVEKAFASKPSEAVRNFLGELYLASGDSEKSLKLMSAAPGAATNPTVQLTQARVAFNKGDFAGTIAAIERTRTLYNTPAQQMDALYLLASAKAALAGNDPAKKQEAALAYMRVVAHFGSKPSPTVLDAMMKTAKLLEDLGKPAEAAELYKQVAQDPQYKTTKAAAEARSSAARLAKPAKP